MSATTQVTVSRTGRHRHPAEDLGVTDVDPRPGAVRTGWSWRTATSLRDRATFWGER
jgi:hypothetical protein